MKVVALISGGKDSCYNLCECVKRGHEIVALLNLYPSTDAELDSFMYQTVGYQALDYYAQAIDIPLYRRAIKGEAINQNLNYSADNENDEVEDLFVALSELRANGVQFDAISVGAIHSNYQRIRAQNVCDRLGIEMLAYLWGRNQQQLLEDMIKDNIDAILIKVAAMGLIPEKHLGKSIKEMHPILLKLHEEYGINVCGEGGEYETLTLDCPLFKKRLILEESETVVHSNDAFAPVAYLKPLKMRLEDK
ncbi:diphthine--ammonia ligase-like protein [Dinothrombium tinctorium]|uniref:Diphthine--ammonia ligase n=1 Tax=Dinothrombium tinctorium TaxID=1965070 RepID=A0A3S3PT91_9ACAR|nr:diphthine--ammonia ligase-like protein [Dinothrombium tinctorium]RWS07725.1 diphthine--ammonia ligase-like protein [Dinothrombium tinctorium]RWS07806.1 diphthine--ammonia ligase-like protein [Dinothrombium tinctorium]